ncbi:MAG TPA: hypothetical protein VEV82_09700 [Actinomycetota bacterium]|nr:hypothetical protein [Actinomycetota bacterium]
MQVGKWISTFCTLHAIGEWNYYIFGSAVEVALLGTIVYYAWTWPTKSPLGSRGD